MSRATYISVNMNHCSETWSMPIRCSAQYSDPARVQQRTIGHWRTTTLNMALALDVAPRNRNQGERPTDERARWIRTACGTYESTTPAHTNTARPNAAPLCGRSHSSLLTTCAMVETGGSGNYRLPKKCAIVRQKAERSAVRRGRARLRRARRSVCRSVRPALGACAKTFPSSRAWRMCSR